MLAFTRSGLNNDGSKACVKRKNAPIATHFCPTLAMKMSRNKKNLLA